MGTCIHLRPHVDWLRRDGAWAVRTVPGGTGGWEEVAFSHGPSLTRAQSWWRMGADVALWSEGAEVGIRCVPCGTVLRWPRPEDGRGEELLERLDAGLRRIMDAELAARNEVEDCVLGWGNPRAVLVLFRHPFRAKWEKLPDGVRYREVNDPHWWKAEYVHEETLGCVACRF